MTDAQHLAQALNLLAKSPQFTNLKVRAAARGDERVDWPATKLLNEDFNADVDGFESFAMRDGSICRWMPGQFKYAGQHA